MEIAKEYERGREAQGTVTTDGAQARREGGVDGVRDIGREGVSE
jgi:hypothetical protein